MCSARRRFCRYQLRRVGLHPLALAGRVCCCASLCARTSRVDSMARVWQAAIWPFPRLRLRLRPLTTNRFRHVPASHSFANMPARLLALLHCPCPPVAIPHLSAHTCALAAPVPFLSRTPTRMPTPSHLPCPPSRHYPDPQHGQYEPRSVAPEETARHHDMMSTEDCYRWACRGPGSSACWVQLRRSLLP